MASRWRSSGAKDFVVSFGFGAATGWSISETIEEIGGGCVARAPPPAKGCAPAPGLLVWPRGQECPRHTVMRLALQLRESYRQRRDRRCLGA
jgi:hypothetical protein